jgi:predicted naringenin-chalcone synthase
MVFMSLAIFGLGTAVPEVEIDQTVASQIARALCCRTSENETWLSSMYGGTDIVTRRSSLGAAVVRDVIEGTRQSGSVFLPTGEPDDRGPTTGQRLRHYAATAPPLALAASGSALERSGVPPGRITHLITVSCTGFLAPGIDVALIQKLGLSPTVERTHVGFMGCHGALNGLRVARAFADADAHARILLCAVELCSPHYHYGWDPQRMIANAIFADGAAALVGGPAKAAPNAWQAAASGSCLIPNSTDAMTWTIGDHGFEMTLSKRVPGLISEYLKPWLESWLEQNGVALSDVRTWAIHPGGPRILSAAEATIGLSPESTAASRAVFAKFGNMSSPTILFILDRLQSENAPRPCVALGFGPGLTAEAALFW